VVKNLIHLLVMPLPLSLICAALAAIFRIRGWRRTAWGLLFAAAGIAYLGSMSVVGDALLEPLEARYAVLSQSESATAAGYVVVLGSSYSPRDGVPVTAAIADDGLARIVEGVRIFRRMPGARLVVSGGAPDGGSPSAMGYAILARDLGVDAAALDILDQPLDTNQEAHALAKLIGNKSFILVTSAYHMPRAVRLMQRIGLHPIPAPTGQSVGIPADVDWRRFVPTSGGLRKTERAIHEYLGLFAAAEGIY
jgi:uncharacterized SAM-binding protein YcdF (DUF218 family)